jgi:hypothetical protein
MPEKGSEIGLYREKDFLKQSGLINRSLRPSVAAQA